MNVIMPGFGTFAEVIDGFVDGAVGFIQMRLQKEYGFDFPHEEHIS